MKSKLVDEQTELQTNPVDEQVEVLSLIGDVAIKPDGTPEVVLTDAPSHLRKTHDAETGLALTTPAPDQSVDVR